MDKLWHLPMQLLQWPRRQMLRDQDIQVLMDQRQEERQQS